MSAMPAPNQAGSFQLHLSSSVIRREHSWNTTIHRAYYRTWGPELSPAQNLYRYAGAGAGQWSENMSALKTLIILSQTLLLLIVAWFTRPAQEDFSRYAAHHGSAASQLGFSQKADVLPNQCTFQDRWLWVEVSKDGKVMYVGAFAHWFDCSMVERNDMSKGIALGEK